MTVIAKIRAELSLPRAWKILGLPGEPLTNTDIKSPFRSDKKPSFRIYAGKDHLRFFDHGDASGGDVIDLWAKAKGVEPRDAIREIQAYLGGGEVPQYRFAEPIRPAEPVLPPEAGFRPPPDMRRPTEEECVALSNLRPGILPGAFHLAGNLGTLKIATVYGVSCWIITDKSGICAEARRMDGMKFILKSNPQKAFCLPGSKKKWPIGLLTDRPEFDALKNILVIEGQPDYYAGLSLAIDSVLNFRSVAILGAAQTIGPEYSQHFRGKTVLIIPHNDRENKGEDAAERWSKQFKTFGAARIAIQRLPIVCDDLCDFLRQNPGAPSDALLQLFKPNAR